MAQHSKPFFWRNPLAARTQGDGRASAARQLDFDLRRQTDASPPSRLLARSRWLCVAGGLAIASALLPAAVLADTVYIVEVLSDSEDVLEVVRTEASDAYIVIKEDGTQSIIAGTFVDEANARKQASALHALNISPTSISPFEYTPEDETVASSDSEVDDAVTEFVASSEPPASSDSAVPAPTAEPQAAAPVVSEETAQEPVVQEVAAPVPGGGNSGESTDGAGSVRQYSALAIVPQGTSPEAALADVQHFFPDASLQPFNGSQAIQTGTFSHRSQAQLQADWLHEKGLHAIAVPADTLSPTSTVAAAPPAENSPAPAAAASPVVEPEAPAVPVAEPSAEAPPVSTPPTGSLSSAVPPETAQPPVAAPLSGEPQVAAATDPAAAPVAAAPVDSAAYWVLVADPVGEKLPEIKAIVPAAESTMYNDQQVVRTGMFATEAEAMDQVRYLSTQGYEAGIFTTADNVDSAAATQPVQ